MRKRVVLNFTEKLDIFLNLLYNVIVDNFPICRMAERIKMENIMTDKQMMEILVMIHKIVKHCENKEEILKELEDLIQQMGGNKDEK